MSLEINFNNPDILKGYVDQALPQREIGNLRPRIIVGKGGGLAYMLFEEDNSCSILPQTIPIREFNELAKTKRYINFLEFYINCAKEHADKFKFIMLEKLPYEELKLMHESSLLYNPCIGDIEIGSVERFEKFIDMVKEGHEELDKIYKKVLTANPWK